MKKISLLVFGLLFAAVSVFGYSTSHFSSYPKKLEQPIEKLLKFPKAQRVLQEAQRRGQISVKLRPFDVSTSNAMWRSDINAIILNSERKRKEGEIIRSVLFELHNAKNHHKFVTLDKQARSNQISKEAYVRSVERVEHQNALDAMRLLDEGIASGYYPNSAKWPIIRDFEDHYKLQQLSGHSQFIAKIYDSLNPLGKQIPYYGSVMAHTLSAKEKKAMMASISEKDQYC